MIEPILSLALAVQSNKGVYALLLGSGVSRAAGVPTGWEIAEDLIRKLALLKGQDCAHGRGRMVQDGIWSRSCIQRPA